MVPYGQLQVLNRQGRPYNKNHGCTHKNH